MPDVLVIAGPTATGKSGLALRLAAELDGEIVNADALQVYRGFDLGTAKPSPGERAAIVHHLIDILEPHEPYSAGEFARRARRVVAEIGARGKLPLVVGGSGLYVRALVEGMSPLPPVDPELRRQLQRRLAEEGLESLRRELAELDPVTEARLAPNDTQRVSRALEVALGSGRPLSSWVAERPFGERRLEAVQVGLTLPRAFLYDRIAVRVGRMVEAGWVGEVSRLLDRGLTISLPAFQAIGYRQIARHLHGELTLEEALEDTVRATKRFAKRQLTWFKKQPDINWFSAQDSDRAVAEVLGYLRRSHARWVHG